MERSFGAAECRIHARALVLGPCTARRVADLAPVERCRVHDVDELVVLRGRAVLQFEQLPAAVEEVAREAAMGRFVHGIDGHVVHDSVLSFDQRLQAAERMLDLDRSQSEPALTLSPGQSQAGRRRRASSLAIASAYSRTAT